jgi:tripartite ATP-independent transporter DctP family solute receptor
VRKVLLATAMGCAAALLIAGCFFRNTHRTNEKEDSSATLVLKFALQNGEDHPLCQGMQKFGELLKEKTDGRITLELHYSASLGSQTTTVQGVQSGTIDGAMLKAGIISNYGCSQLKVFTFPYLFDSVAHARAFEKSSDGKALLDSLQSSGSRLVCIGAYQEGARNYFFTEKNVQSPEDMKGLMIRCQEGAIYRDIVEALGANAQSVAFSELYSALQSGVVDGAEQPISGFAANNYSQICKYYILDQHEISPNLILFSEATWNQLSEDDKKVVQEAFDQSVDFFEQISDKKDEEYLKEMKRAGVIISKVDREQWQAACDSIYDTYRKEFSSIINQIKDTKY